MFVLTRSQDIDYGLLERKDVDDMVNMLASVFSRFDPPTVAAGLTFDDLHVLMQRFGSRAPEEGLTLIARSQSSGELVGAMLSDDFARERPEHLEGLSPRFKPLAALRENLDERFRRFHQILPGRFLYLYLLGVAPEFGGKGIAHALVRLALDFGRQKGYERAVTEATGAVSQHVFRNYGFIERFRIPYQEFVYQGDHIFKSIVDHEAVILLERHLLV